MNKRRPNADKITNELAGGSAFFRKSPPHADPQPTPEQVVEPEPVATAPIPDAAPRTPVRPVLPKRRQMIRHSFEVYMDQLERLRDLADGQRERGEIGSMSRMVRDAIDRLLNDHPSDNS